MIWVAYVVGLLTGLGVGWITSHPDIMTQGVQVAPDVVGGPGFQCYRDHLDRYIMVLEER